MKHSLRVKSTLVGVRRDSDDGCGSGRFRHLADAIDPEPQHLPASRGLYAPMSQGLERLLYLVTAPYSDLRFAISDQLGLGGLQSHEGTRERTKPAGAIGLVYGILIRGDQRVVFRPSESSAASIPRSSRKTSSAMPSPSETVPTVCRPKTLPGMDDVDAEQWHMHPHAQAMAP
ncbi:hypothetical protein AURDEDRAFT_177607 [Auricularia subglabra TFB-10046 SS5]|uniref:Uncharacterized protein n=1 Tax=Auricularia subglabra (strain TFB-10046 / SS5) TaxID=717982 RepID=J0CSQ3_AURST|nr:hypothetical protein AURDEDRAFT_177607 [Auricularia subglabra TFB-10046 SS5]